MKNSYAKKWQKEIDKLRNHRARLRPDRRTEVGQAVLHVPEEERCHHHPAQGIVRVLFLQGSSAQRPKAHPGKNRGAYPGLDERGSNSPRVREIASQRSTLTDYLYEAIALEESGKKLTLKKPSEYPVPEELQSLLNDNAVLRAAFAALYAWPQKILHLPHLRREAGNNKNRARGKMCAADSQWPRIQ